jgi:hypothetical protein
MLFYEEVAKKIREMKEGDIVEPGHEMIPEKDHILGTMSKKLRKLFTLYYKVGKEVVDSEMASFKAIMKIIGPLELMIEPKKSDIDEAMRKISDIQNKVFLLKEREEALKSIFWISVKNEFPILKREFIGKSLSVAKGFKVAWREPEEEVFSAEEQFLVMFSD